METLTTTMDSLEYDDNCLYCRYSQMTPTALKYGDKLERYFYKDINNFIQTKTEQRRYSELGLPADLLPDGKTINDIFNVSSPQNSGSSGIQGFELALQRDLDFLPAPFQHSGVIANYTWADGDTLYFVARGDGSHHFSATYTEHRRAVQRYQLGGRP